MRDLIVERTGAADSYGGYFKLNPKVDDIPDEYSKRIGNVRLLALGGVTRGGGGCICPASSLIKALLTHLVLGSDDALVMDMEAGIEHLGRATAQSMDALLLVVDGSPWSVQTALRVRTLGADIGLQRMFAVVNRVNESTNIELVRQWLDGIPVVGTIPYDPRLHQGIVEGALDQRLEPTEVLIELLPRIDDIIRSLH
jgi:CO dehydrogenase maturation factor